jgi:hypothetical protein
MTLPGRMLAAVVLVGAPLLVAWVLTRYRDNSEVRQAVGYVLVVLGAVGFFLALAAWQGWL